MSEYRGKAVVITGAASGLGAAMADVFAAAGARLALFDIDADRVEVKASELRNQGRDVIALPIDVANRVSVSAAAAMVEERFGGCDVLCANVGVQQFGAIANLTAQDWSWLLSVNVMGVIDTVACFLPLLRRSTGERHIVLTSSASYFQPGVRMGAYVTSKFAVVGYGEVLREEMISEGINVSLLFPAGMITRHLESSAAARPAAFGEYRIDRTDIEAMMVSAGIKAETHLATATHAVRNLLAELRDKQPYIITHGDYKEQVEARQGTVLAAFDRMLANP